MAVYPKDPPRVASVLRLLAVLSLAGGLLAALDGPPRLVLVAIVTAVVGAALLFAVGKIIDLLHDIRQEAAAAVDALSQRPEDDG